MKTLAPDSAPIDHAPAARWPVFLAAITAIAATYVYFLIFAEFAFLEFAARICNAGAFDLFDLAFQHRA